MSREPIFSTTNRCGGRPNDEESRGSGEQTHHLFDSYYLRMLEALQDLNRIAEMDNDLYRVSRLIPTQGSNDDNRNQDDISASQRKLVHAEERSQLQSMLVSLAQSINRLHYNLHTLNEDVDQYTLESRQHNAKVQSIGHRLVELEDDNRRLNKTVSKLTVSKESVEKELRKTAKEKKLLIRHIKSLIQQMERSRQDQQDLQVLVHEQLLMVSKANNRDRKGSTDTDSNTSGSTHTCAADLNLSHGALAEVPVPTLATSAQAVPLRMEQDSPPPTEVQLSEEQDADDGLMSLPQQPIFLRGFRFDSIIGKNRRSDNPEPKSQLLKNSIQHGENTSIGSSCAPSTRDETTRSDDSLRQASSLICGVAQAGTVALDQHATKTTTEGINFSFLKKGKQEYGSSVYVARSRDAIDNNGDATGLGEQPHCNVPTEGKHSESIAEAMLSFWKWNVPKSYLGQPNTGHY